MSKIRAINKISLPKVKSAQRLTHKHKKELPFVLNPCGTMDFSSATFANSDAFSKMIDKAHRHAIRANHKFGK